MLWGKNQGHWGQGWISVTKIEAAGSRLGFLGPRLGALGKRLKPMGPSLGALGP